MPSLNTSLTIATLATLALFAACGDAAPDANTDTENTSDALTCENLIERFDAYTEANKSCEVVDDCVVVAAPEPCSCAPSLGDYSGEAINIDAEAGAQPYIELFNSGECGDIGAESGCDIGPYRNLDCVEGRCVVDEGIESCLLPE
ncbi:hypothetical protein FRC96_17110 [Lujinxingia vulgaris]|uniref:Uncharacterized protein n=1 Tax=Lujinxingia vulgaris TaxID=2600176 RepID=A0A5C6WV36_9DELT|nr:hypothetical protein [Lujinxingia vulgaris]TXD32558.1 hypothetical protein FRC96_17110 [Lujinxingia vulgaris]